MCIRDSGRSGRQGDPGKSRFYLSTEDDLMRLFGGDRMKMVMDRLNAVSYTHLDVYKRQQLEQAIQDAVAALNRSTVKGVDADGNQGIAEVFFTVLQGVRCV